MRRINTPNRAPDLFGAGKDGFRNGDVTLGVPPTEFNAEWCNAVQEELASVVEAAGLTLSTINAAQLLEAIKRMIDIQAGNYVLDTGAANAYVVALDPVITAYTNGMTVRFRAVNANTGASTLNAGGGAVGLVNDLNGALASGDIPAGCIISATYDSTANKFLINSLVPSQVMTQAQGDARYAALAGLGSQNFAANRLTQTIPDIGSITCNTTQTFTAGGGPTAFNLNAQIAGNPAALVDITNHRFVIQQSGNYLISYSGQAYGAGANGNLVTMIYKNGVNLIYGQSGCVSSGYNAAFAGAAVVALTAGDLIMLYGTATTQNMLCTTGYVNTFNINRLP